MTNTNTLLLLTIISIGGLTTLILVIIYNTPTEPEFFSYDPKFVHLVLSHPVATIAKAKDMIPDRKCFDVTDDTLNQYSEQFRNALKNASQSREDELWSNNFIPDHNQEFDFPITTQESLVFLGKYNFIENKSPLWYGADYGYKCFFDYHNKQYIIWFAFAVPHGSGRNDVNVNFTNSNLGKIIANSDVTVYQQFNGTVLFNNYLDHDLVLTFTFVRPTSYHNEGPDDIRIPPGQTLPYFFDNYDVNNHITYQYLIRPDNLQGSVTVKNPEKNCLTMKDAKSLYSLVNVTLKFPQYMPDGYRYKCGIFVMTKEFISLYDNNTASLKQSANYAGAKDFVKEGGLSVEYDKIISSNYFLMKSNEQNMQKNRTIMPSGQYFGEVNGNPTIIYHGPFSDSSIQVSSIGIYAKDGYTRITGNFTVDELERVTQSMK